MQGCFNIWKPTGSTTVIKWKIEGRSQNSGGVGWGDHFLPHKFIKTSFSFECWETSTKQLLNSGGGHQGPRKAAHSLQNEVGQNIKDKKRDKRIRNGDQSLGGSQRRRSFQTAGNLPTSGSVGSLGVSEGDITGRKKEKKKKPTEYAPNRYSQWRSSPDTHIHQQRAGADQGGTGCIIGP